MKLQIVKPKKLGVAQSRGRYDLPLNRSAGTYFLMLLVALMTFLAMMSLAATMFIGSISDHWSSGLENKITIEIPAVNRQGDIREKEDIKDLAQKVTLQLNV